MKTQSTTLLIFLMLAAGSLFGQSKLNYKVLNGSSFNNVVQTVIYGDKDCVLIDGGLFNSDAHRAIAAILDLQRNLTTIYITHPDADHYFGLAMLTKAFPNAKVVALPQVADDIMGMKDKMLGIWKGLYPAFANNFPDNLADVSVNKIGTKDSAVITLEGNELKVVGMQRGDQEHSSFVWVAPLRMIVSGDIVYNSTYPWTAGTKPEERARWIKSVNNIIAFKPAVLVPGHTDPAAPYTIAGAYFTRDYLAFYDRQILRSHTKAAFLAAIKRKYPVRMSDLALQLGAADAYPEEKK